MSNINNTTEMSEQQQIRRESLKKIRELGIDPYPAEKFPVNVTAKEIKEEYDEEKENLSDVVIAGRIMTRRIMGNASFFELQDHTGRIQVYVKRDDLCPGEDKTLYTKVFRRLLDIGDVVGIKGHVFTTRTGEISVYCKELKLLSKSLRPLPIVKEKDDETFDAFTDPEQRFRQRYVDLIVNPEVKDIFLKRAKIISTIRRFFDDKSYLEVETPTLQAIPGGAAARPFVTHHNALDIPLYLRVAKELYLKKLIVGGYMGVYEFGKDFRNEGMDRTHNPEFTQVELYVAYKDYIWMMELVEELFEHVALTIHGTTELTISGKQVSFKRPFRRLSMSDAIKNKTGLDIIGKNLEQMRQACDDLGVEYDETMGVGKLIDEVFDKYCEDDLIQPTFITDYPVEMSPLSKVHRDNPELTERFEMFVLGKEVCNAYSELNDPIDQLERFREQAKLGERGDDEAMFVDMDYVRALEYGMPSCAGLGIGIDRMAMLMTDNDAIQEVLFFPQMRPEQGGVDGDEKYIGIGIPQEWIEPLKGMGLTSIDSIKKLKPTQLHNDICGYNKKHALGLANPSLEEITTWIEG